MLSKSAVLWLTYFGGALCIASAGLYFKLGIEYSIPPMLAWLAVFRRLAYRDSWRQTLAFIILAGGFWVYLRQDSVQREQDRLRPATQPPSNVSSDWTSLTLFLASIGVASALSFSDRTRPRSQP